MQLTAGVIGCGNISKYHFSGLEKAGVRIKWVCDLNAATAKPWADKYGAQYTADYHAVLADPEVNVVNITALSFLHKAMCFDAIAAGKAVICEKTLAETADDALAIVQRAESAGTVFYTSYMKRFIPAVEQAKALLPKLGRILSTHIRAYQCWGNLWEDTSNTGFFGTPKGGMSEVRRRYGGGILVCGGSHILDLVVFLLGRPHRLFAQMHTPPGRDLDVQAAALLETANGIVHYEALAHPLHKIGFLRDGWDERFEINGTQGRLEMYSSAWTDIDTKASLLVHYDNATGQAVEYRTAPQSPFDRAMAFFCANIAKGEQGTQSRLTGYEVDELIAHIKKSADTHQALDVTWRA
jgi:predicted dehydrogenase